MISGWIGENHRQMIVTDSEESLPADRLINPEEYEENRTTPLAVHAEENSSG